MEDDSLAKFLKEESQKAYPTEVIKRVFPDKVMKVISSDHHKHCDGSFTIAYDYYLDKWYVSHSGYVREVEVEGDSYEEVMSRFLREIERENNRVLYQELEDFINSQISEKFVVEIEDSGITLYEYEKGENRLGVASFDKKYNTQSPKELLKEVKKIIKEKDADI